MSMLTGFMVLLPLSGFLLLALFGRRWSKNVIGTVGSGSVGISTVLAGIVTSHFIASGDEPMTLHLGSWFTAGNLQPGFTFVLDALSSVFVLVITFVGFLIHLYSAGFMREEKDLARFFAYMNLFVASMLILVLADNLVLLYLGWEGVGLCSFLLIGYWYQERANTQAARKAFIVTRIGDTAMAIGLFLLFAQFNTLNITSILENVPQSWTKGSSVATWGALLLLGGALGKSAQLPLQTWLPDAMAGPSPVSALIHAATMVTAGVYLIARMHVVFSYAPEVMMATATIGAVTLLVAGCSALVQRDIKKVLAYSTISQIGYMFLALGVGAWSAGIFHFMTHAFFKALLFLGAGVVIAFMHHEHDMTKMGGLKKYLPVTYITFLAGAASLAALPVVTAGFYSKDAILWYTWTSTSGSKILWLAGITGAFITAIYTFRMVFLTFYGRKDHGDADYKPGLLITIPLIILSVLSIIAGFVELPHNVAHVALISDWLENTLPATVSNEPDSGGWILQTAPLILTLLGVYIAYYFYLLKPFKLRNFDKRLPGFHQFLYEGLYFDRLYEALLVKPTVKLAQWNKHDGIDKIYIGIARMVEALHLTLSRTQTGQLRWYLAGLTFGAVIIITIIALI